MLAKAAPLRLAARRLKSLGFDVRIDESALARQQRFAGSDDVRLAALHRVATEAPSIAMATRGGYGLTRLLDRIDWKLLGRSVAQGTRWVGYSDVTALQLGLLAHAKATSWAGPLAVDDFGREELDDVTVPCFTEAMSGELEAVGFRTEAGFDGLEARGTLWGGNLAMVCSLLGTKHLPRVKGGVLFLEDVNEHPYRVERQLLQLPAGRRDRRAEGRRPGSVHRLQGHAAGPWLHVEIGDRRAARPDEDACDYRVALRPRRHPRHLAGGPQGHAAGRRRSALIGW